MSKNTTVKNPMKVITGEDTRWSYANVWEPKSINGGAPKYSVSLIIPKSDTKTVAKIKAAIEAAYTEGESKLKGNSKSVPPLTSIKTPLRDGDVERPDDPAYANAYLSMQTLLRHPALWMQTSILCLPARRCIPVSMAAPASRCTHSTRTAIAASPAASITCS